MPEAQRPYFSVSILLIKEGQVFLQFRTFTTVHDGTYSLPSGKVDDNETALEAAIREAKEEAGVEVRIEDLELIYTLNRFAKTGKRQGPWVDLFFLAKQWKGEAINAEPDKCSHSNWYTLENLPLPLMPMTSIMLSDWKQGNTFGTLGFEKH